MLSKKLWSSRRYEQNGRTDVGVLLNRYRYRTFSGNIPQLMSVIPTLCANLDELDEPDAKASLIWIIGEYAEKINNADELLGIFVDSFTKESYPVSACNSLFRIDLTFTG
jgi:vesicle coat complex subunit